jgi:hypothetical protein
VIASKDQNKKSKKLTIENLKVAHDLIEWLI